MAHYAFLDENNIVTEVIVGIEESELIEGKDPQTWYGEFRGQRCIRTSYNGTIRARFAGIGYTYDEQRDVFIAPQPFPSWTLNDATTDWAPPTLMPAEGGPWLWDEETLSWKDMSHELPAI